MNSNKPNDRPLVVVTQQPFAATRERLSEHARLIVNETRDAWSPAQLLDYMAEAHGLMAFMTDCVDEQFLSHCPRLRVVGGALKGYDNIDIDACTQHGVWVTNVPDLLTVPTAELAIGLTIGIARHIVPGDAFVRSGIFNGWTPRFYGTGLAGRTIGIVGLGIIGQAITRRLSGFDVQLCYSDPQVHKTDQNGIERLSLDALLSTSDIVILAAPLTNDTLHLINEDSLARMQSHALLVNPGRGSVVDETAVRDALIANRLGGYAADVFEMEDLSREARPREIDAGLRQHPRTLFTPHLGSAVAEVRQSIELRAAENIIRVLDGDPPLDGVNTPTTHATEC